MLQLCYYYATLVPVPQHFYIIYGYNTSKSMEIG